MSEPDLAMNSVNAASNLTPIINRPAYLLVFEALQEEILSGRLGEDAAIPTEMELCRQFNVQRSTIREGIRLLEQSGLARRGSGKRLYATRPKTSEAAESTSRGLERHGVRFIDIWEAIATILPETAVLAARKMRPKHLAQLHQLTADLEASEDSEQMVFLSVEYLQAVWESTENRVISIMLQSLNMLVQSSLREVFDALPNPRTRILSAQKHMNTAFGSSDGTLAAKWMARHVDDLRRGYEVAGVDLKRQVAPELTGRSPPQGEQP